MQEEITTMLRRTLSRKAQAYGDAATHAQTILKEIALFEQAEREAQSRLSPEGRQAIIEGRRKRAEREARRHKVTPIAAGRRRAA
jgi:hypothetical protein